MNIKTITSTEGVNEVDFGSSASRFYWFQNLGTTAVHVSANADIVAGADGVAELAAGGVTCIETTEGKVYVLGAGKVQIHNTGDKFCPFKIAPAAGGGITGCGNPVVMDGLQGNVPFSITVSGKNLVYYDIEKIKNAHTAGKWDKNVYTISNVVVTFGTDGIIAMSGTAAANIAIALNWNTNNTMIELAAGSYTISGCPKQNGLSLKLVSSDGSEVYTCQETCTIDVRGGKYKFYINVEKSTVLESVNICAQLELGATATDYEPPIVGRELTLNVCGKNLIPYPFANSSKTANGITFTDNGDGTVTANGTATADSTFYFANKTVPVNPKNKYYLSGCPTGGSGSTYDIVFASYDTDNAVVNAYNDTGNGKSVTVSGNAKNASLYIRIRSGQTVDNMIFRPQLEFGNTATAYESYHGSTVKIASDSNPYVVPNDIRQQDGLNIVSVSDGTLSVTGVRKNLALKRIWDKIDEITTAVIVANGEN